GPLGGGIRTAGQPERPRSPTPGRHGGGPDPARLSGPALASGHSGARRERSRLRRVSANQGADRSRQRGSATRAQEAGRDRAKLSALPRRPPSGRLGGPQPFRVEP